MNFKKGICMAATTGMRLSLLSTLTCKQSRSEDRDPFHNILIGRRPETIFGSEENA
jgi:hypothetical protein